MADRVVPVVGNSAFYPLHPMLCSTCIRICNTAGAIGSVEQIVGRRLVAISKTQVTFRWKDRVHGG